MIHPLYVLYECTYSCIGRRDIDNNLYVCIWSGNGNVGGFKIQSINCEWTELDMVKR